MTETLYGLRVSIIGVVAYNWVAWANLTALTKSSGGELRFSKHVFLFVEEFDRKFIFHLILRNVEPIGKMWHEKHIFHAGQE